MALISTQLIRDLLQIIRQHHVAIAAHLFGPHAVTPEEWQLAVDLGLVTPGAPGKISELYQIGSLIAHLVQSGERPPETLAELRDRIQRHPVPLLAVEDAAATYNVRVGASYVTALGDRAAHRAAEVMTDAERAVESRTRSIIRDVTSARFGDLEAQARLKQAGVSGGLPPGFIEDSFRQTAQRAASDLGHLTKEWTRDLLRITTTEGVDAMNHGISSTWEQIAVETANAQGGAPPRVLAYKIARSDACEHCQRLHTGAGGAPRLYWLDEVQAHGTNVRKRAHEWEIVIGPTHPWCYCTLHRVPFPIIPRVTGTAGWVSGEACPSVIGPGGSLV